MSDWKMMSKDAILAEQLRSAERAKDYSAIYDQDIDVKEKPHGWIQWKGTSVCMDLHCVCGTHSHFDGDFFYHFRCSGCGAHYAVGQNVLLIPLTAEQVQRIGAESSPMTAFQEGE